MDPGKKFLMSWIRPILFIETVVKLKNGTSRHAWIHASSSISLVMMDLKGIM